jgi:hypothetical protein
MKTGRLLAVLLLAVTMMSRARAQDQEPAQGQEPVAGPAAEGGQQPDVARVSLIHGDVSMQRGDSGDWVAATLNTPLVRGDQMATSEKSRLEVQLNYANILRLAANSQAKIADLTRTRIQIQIAQGYANYSVYKGNEADVEIDTPNVSVKPLRPGRYRVQVNSDLETDVIVRDGEAEITTPQGSTTVKEGQLITIRGSDNPEYKVADAPSGDDWDRFNKDRDRVIKDANAWQKTNQYYTGSHDLDGNGRWVYVPGYGEVWQPYQQVGWAPYQSGRWVWEPYYGWTWVSYEPWGWAPYHYGRWFFYGASWVWWPGPVYVHYRPLWAPAFVFFVGFGHHSSFGFGSIGWCPVGPFDHFYPWYGRGFNHINVVNITNINVVNVRNVHVIGPLGIHGHHPYYSNAHLLLTNAHVRGGITSVSSEDFGRGVMSHRRFGADAAQIREAHVMQGNLGVVPTRENLHGGAGVHAEPAVAQGRGNERFFTRHAPPSGPTSFHDTSAQMQRVIEAHGGPAAGNGGENGRGQGRFGGNNPDAGTGRMNQPVGVDTKIGTKTVNNGPQGGGAGGEQNGRGWGRFGGNNPDAGTGRMNQPVGVDTKIGTKTVNNGPGGGAGGENDGSRQGGFRGVGHNGQQGGSPNNSSPASDAGKGDGSRQAVGAGGGNTPSRGWTRFGGREQSGPGNSGQGGSSHDNNPNLRVTTPEDRGSSPDLHRGQGGNQPPSSNQGSTWQRFPSGGDSRGNMGSEGRVYRDDRSGGSSKPPLVMDKQVITPREDRRSYSPQSNDSRSNSGPPQYHDSRSMSGPPQYHGGGMSGPPPSSRSEVHSGPPPSSHSSMGGGSMGGGGMSHGSSGGGGGSHSSSSGGGSHSSSGGSHSSGSSDKSSSGHHR